MRSMPFELALAAVLIGDLGGYRGLGGAVVEALDQRRVALGDEAAADFLRARQFAVVGVEFLGQDEEAPDLRARHRRLPASERLTASTCFCDQLGDPRMAGEFLIGGVGDAIALGPVADRSQFDVEHHGDEIAAVADRHGLANVGEEFQLVLDIFGREQLPVGEPADVLGAIDDLELAVRLEEAGVAGLDEAVLGQRLRASFPARCNSRRTCRAT